MDEHIRQLNFPQGFTLLRDLFKQGYTHPDNPEWDEDEELNALIEKLDSTRRLWPVFRPFFPGLPRMFAGLIWEEDGKPVGAISAMLRAMGSRDYIISSAVVLPRYRGRGIALRLTEAMRQLLNGWGAEKALATCLSGNTPVLRIAEAHGATAYDRQHETRLPADEAFPAGGLSEGVRLEPARGAWEELIAFAQRITPAEAQRFDPVRASDFRPGLVERVGLRLSNMMAGYSASYHLLREGDALRGYLYANLPRRAEGSSRLMLRIDPAHEARLAAGTLAHAVTMARTANPAGSIALRIPSWQPHALAAAREGGFITHREWTHIGYTF